jgi:hypothetical protein
MVMLASQGYNMKKVRDLVQKELVNENEDLASFTFHDCRVSNQGLTVHIIEDENVGVESFDLAWQCPDN